MVSIPRDVRGGSHVIPMDFGQAGDQDYHCITHEVDLFDSEVGRKDGLYKHRFLVWNKEWQCCAFLKIFLLWMHVEFCTGMCYYKGDLLMTFGFKIMLAYLFEFL